MNATTTEDAWTALMVACGSPVDTDDMIRKLIKAGAKATAVDGDGWTALHWSAFHGRPEAAEALLESVSVAEREALFKAKSNDGKTAREVAQGEDNDDVVDVIDKFTSSKAGDKKKDEDESALRRRKQAPGTSSVEDVD